ncbi:MAG: hypothetical protein V4772_03475 [Pseudomonadota bacterium]
MRRANRKQSSISHLSADFQPMAITIKARFNMRNIEGMPMAY